MKPVGHSSRNHTHTQTQSRKNSYVWNNKNPTLDNRCDAQDLLFFWWPFIVMMILCNPGHLRNTDQSAINFLQNINILIHNDKRTLGQIWTVIIPSSEKAYPKKIWRCISLGPDICRFKILTISWNSIPLNLRVETSVSRRVFREEYTWFFFYFRNYLAFKLQIHILNRGKRKFHDTRSLMIAERVWIKKIPLGLHSPCHPTAYQQTTRRL